MQITSLNSVKDWLSYDIVRFKIKVGVEEKFMCENITKQTQHGDRAVAGELWLSRLNSFTLYFNIRHSA